MKLNSEEEIYIFAIWSSQENNGFLFRAKKQICADGPRSGQVSVDSKLS